MLRAIAVGLGLIPSLFPGVVGVRFSEGDRRRGAKTMRVAQNIDLALETSGRCLVMEKGRIVHEGAPDDLRDEAVLSKYLAI